MQRCDGRDGEKLLGENRSILSVASTMIAAVVSAMDYGFTISRHDSTFHARLFAGHTLTLQNLRYGSNSAHMIDCSARLGFNQSFILLPPG
jgi:hypothetical protein